VSPRPNTQRNISSNKSPGRSDLNSIFHNEAMALGSVPQPVVEITKMTRCSEINASCNGPEHDIAFIRKATYRWICIHALQTRVEPDQSAFPRNATGSFLSCTNFRGIKNQKLTRGRLDFHDDCVRQTYVRLERLLTTRFPKFNRYYIIHPSPVRTSRWTCIHAGQRCSTQESSILTRANHWNQIEQSSSF
jgi:hypothetical protein